ncbi:hypothetical protein L873DRAFT_1905956 [Choiromyces venosus 120613-1]|uniref:GPI inositol-deacylase winged helix domain-containing protein n=1 Tax=Choiromyces venosus 120613-1 TaxID=1336337 RepID=A0A3N4IR80_9PEZI|nr:hypothetical protein L873DRAFT_1905956 [Choiromyces venosus 120613-1]
MLQAAIASRERVFICVDAFDEALPEYRLDFLDALREISQESPSVHIFFTGRHFVCSEVERYFPGVQVISVNPTTDDIKRYLTIKLDNDTEPDAMDDRLKGEILRIIPETISEIFLLVSLSIETILGEITISKRRKNLQEMTKQQNVWDVYTATLERIKAQKGSKSRLAMDAPMWISHSERPLEPEELCEALGVELETDDLDIDNVPSIRAIVACSLGLVTIDSSSPRVRLVHFTLQEYLHANPTLFQNTHSMMAEVCLTYLNFQYIRELPPTRDWAPWVTPFLDYALCCWGTHTKKESTESVIPLALRLPDAFDDHISSKLLILHLEYLRIRRLDEEGSPKGFTGLHGASYFGVKEIMVTLLQIKEWDTNATDLGGNTILGWAARQGNEGVVMMLLNQGVINPDMADNYGRPTLGWVAGSNEVVQHMLLERHNSNPPNMRSW